MDSGAGFDETEPWHNQERRPSQVSAQALTEVSPAMIVMPVAKTKCFNISTRSRSRRFGGSPSCYHGIILLGLWNGSGNALVARATVQRFRSAAHTCLRGCCDGRIKKGDRSRDGSGPSLG